MGKTERMRDSRRRALNADPPVPETRSWQLRPWMSIALAVVALSALVLIAYAGNLNNGFVWDDNQQIVMNPRPPARRAVVPLVRSRCLGLQASRSARPYQLLPAIPNGVLSPHSRLVRTSAAIFARSQPRICVSRGSRSLHRLFEINSEPRSCIRRRSPVRSPPRPLRSSGLDFRPAGAWMRNLRSHLLQPVPFRPQSQRRPESHAAFLSQALDLIRPVLVGLRRCPAVEGNGNGSSSHNRILRALPGNRQGQRAASLVAKA